MRLVNRGHRRYSEPVDRDELLRVLRALRKRRALEYVLIGATAMGFHGSGAATEDIDLFIRATPENVERLRQALRSAYAGDPDIDDPRRGPARVPGSSGYYPPNADPL